MDSIEKFSWTANLSKITSDWSNGNQFKNPNLSPTMVIVDGTGPGVDEKLHVTTPSEAAIIDSWNQRKQSK